MNRIIKFRVYQKQDKEWVYREFKEADDIWEEVYSGLSYDYLCQYTGLKDKNGREIYEGDIVKCPVSGKSFEHLQLEAGEKDFVIRTVGIPEVYMEGLPDDCEVIGNSFENPNLLNKEK